MGQDPMVRTTLFTPLAMPPQRSHRAIQLPEKSSPRLFPFWRPGHCFTKIADVSLYFQNCCPCLVPLRFHLAHLLAQTLVEFLLGWLPSVPEKDSSVNVRSPRYNGKVKILGGFLVPWEKVRGTTSNFGKDLGFDRSQAGEDIVTCRGITGKQCQPPGDVFLNAQPKRGQVEVLPV